MPSVLCCAALHRAVLRCTVLCCAVPCCRRVLPGLVLKGISAVWPEHVLLQEQQEEQQRQNRPSSPCNKTIVNTSGDIVGTYSDSTNADLDQEYDVAQNVDASLVFELRQAAADELAAAVAGPAFHSGRQDLPVDLKAAPPLYWPTERVSTPLCIHCCCVLMDVQLLSCSWPFW